MFNKTSKTCITFVISFCLISCTGMNTEVNKSQVGAALGGLLGAVAGSAVDKDNRVVGALIGGVIGAGVGYMIGQRLDKKDQADLKARIEEAAERNSTGKQTVWESDHSGASATITPVEPPRQIEETKSIAKDPEVVIDKVPLIFATGQRRSTTEVNVRLGAGTHYPVKKVLCQGEVVNVIGMTDNGWYLIAEGDTTVGYVSGRYLQKIEESRESSIRQIPASIETKPQGPRREVEAAASQAKNTEEVNVLIARNCRPVRVRLKTADGQVTEETVTTCQNSEGSWGH